MFLTSLQVGIPPGRSKWSQSPQIGSMFLTRGPRGQKMRIKRMKSRNPLKSGQCFLLRFLAKIKHDNHLSRNPLKSGQCFLRCPIGTRTRVCS